jgi:hypothetical protein
MGVKMSKFERKFGRYAIRNLSFVLIACYAAGFMISLINADFLNYLSLNPYAIIAQGQVWRLVTWIIIPPSMGMNLFFILIMLYFYYSIGTNLERTWGTYRYNVYLLSGMLYTIIGAFILMGYIYLFEPGFVATTAGAQANFQTVATIFSTYYVNMSIFLAYAATFSENQVTLFFVIPIKVKYLGIIYGVILVVEFIQGSIFSRVVILASMLNFIIFFLRSRRMRHLSPRQVKRRHDFKTEVRKSQPITRHQCAICGITEEQDPTREFRFCSKCDGNYEYCDQHLYTHTHIKKD